MNDEYLDYFQIYCLITQEKKEQAQMLFDLISETENVDKFFSNKFNILMGYIEKDNEISDDNILYFHLSHKTNENFLYAPNIDTDKFIWRYLSNSNLLKKIDTFDVENIDEINLLEKATHEGVYSEKELLKFYKKFQFDINQLLNANENYKVLPKYQGRALLYQRLILSVDEGQKLNYAFKLKNLFNKSKLNKAFESELANILKNIDPDKVPLDFTNFYNAHIDVKKSSNAKIKFNNKIIHQSKLLNYFLNKTSLPKVEKETNELLKKIKRNKKYLFSKKDILLLETLKVDGVKIDKKYSNLYDYSPQISSKYSKMINNNELGLLMLNLVDIIGEDEIKDLDIESIEFIIGIMNTIKIIDIRNELLIDILPLNT